MLLRFLLLAALASMAQGAVLRPDPPTKCDECAEWNRPVAPFKVFGNTYYVGTEGLSALLVTSDKGHILLDGGIAQTAPLIEANMRTLGFRLADVELILNSHAHFDHAAGINALQRASGAVVATSESGAAALKAGMPVPDDPQYAWRSGFPPVQNVRVAKDNEVLRVGELAITTHYTPGHTPGSTTWSWQSCEGARCLTIVYADSLSAVSAPEFRFTSGGSPTPADRFRDSIAKVERLPCDIVISTHPFATGLLDKLKRWKANPEVNPFIDSNGCRAYAAAARKGLERRITEEKGGVQ